MRFFERESTVERDLIVELIRGLEKDEEKIMAQHATDSAGVGLFQIKLILMCGLIWIAWGFEIVVIKSVTPLLACTWVLRRLHGALLNTITIASIIFGCVMYGILSDKYGRRTALSSALIFLFVFGAVSAGLPNYIWFVVFRAVTGFSLGGLPQTFVLCCEFFPSNTRGHAIYALSCFRALGIVIMLWVLYGVMENENKPWRVFVAVGTIPAFLAMCLIRIFPESFRYLQLPSNKGSYFAANMVMAKMLEKNKKKVTALLQHLPPMRSRNLVLDFFKGPLVRSSLLLWLMGCATSISFSGLAAITPYIVYEGTHDEDRLTNVSNFDFCDNLQEPIDCIPSMPREEFTFRVWTTALDFPGIVIYFILVEVIDRRVLLCVSYALSSLFIFLNFIPLSNRLIYILFAYCARTLLLGQFDLLLVMAAELFPTSHRGTAVGIEVAIFYLGQFLSPYINFGLLSPNKKDHMYIRYKMLYVYGAWTFVCSVLCWALHETRGTALEDVLENHSVEFKEASDQEAVDGARSISSRISGDVLMTHSGSLTKPKGELDEESDEGGATPSSTRISP